MTGLYSCEKREQPWADELGFPPSFFRLETDSMFSLNYSHKDQKDTILLKGDVVYSAVSEVDWVVVPEKNKRHSNLVVHIKENRSQQARETSIILAPQTKDEGVEAIKIDIKQCSSAPFLYVTQKEVSLNSTSFTLKVENNIKDFHFKNPWWITLSDSSAINDFIKKYTFTVDASYFDDRTDNLMIQGDGDNSDLKDTIIINQLKTKFPNPGSDLSLASLFDIAFTIDSAKDYSSYAFDLPAKSPTNEPTLVYDGDLNRYVASFGASQETYYKLNYTTGGTAYSDQFSQDFTIEVCFKPDLTNTGVATVIGSLQFGGMTVEYDANGIMAMKLGSGDKGFYDYYTIGNVQLQAGKYYDVVCTVNYSTKTARMYVNGELKAEVEIDDSGYRLPYYGADRWFGLGCNETDDDAGENFFSGKIAFTRFYPKGKTAAKVQSMYQDVLSRRTLSSIPDLQNTIVNVLPQKLAIATQEQKGVIKDAISVGWKLMNNTSVTNEIIQTYLDNVDVMLNSL